MLYRGRKNMNKLLPIIIVGILVISGLGAVATIGEETKQEKMTLSFSQLTIHEDGNYVTLELEGLNSVLMKPNKPMLPTSIHTFTFPFGTKIGSVKCTSYDVQQQYISKHIMPAPEPVLAGYNAVEKQVEKPVLYGDDPYPNTWFEYDVGCGLKDNERCVFVKVQVFPVQYFPSEHMIETAGGIEINVEYEKPIQPVLTDEEYKLVVITPSEFADELEDLIDHKNSRDVSTKLVTLSEIYGGTYFPVQGRDDQEKIKYFVKNSIENWGVTNVLLVGGSDDLPVRETHVKVSSSDSEIFVSDLYYADIYNDTYVFCSWDSNGNDNFAEYDWGSSHSTDDLDLHPDVFLGRLACKDEDEVTTCVNKIITYEINEAYTQDWFTDIVVIGGDSFPGDNDGVNEGEYVNEAVIDVMDGFIPTKLWVSNNKLIKMSPTGVSQINDAIGAGCGFVDFSGHGNTNLYATHPHENENKWVPTPIGGYFGSNIKSLENGNKLPIVVTGACSVGKFNKDKNCFSWSFLSASNGGGIGSFGATALGYAYLGRGVTHGLVEGMALGTFEAYKEGAATLGEMWADALNGYMDSHRINDGGEYKTILEWQLFGDPTLAIGEESLAPVKPGAPDGPATGGADVEYTYTAFTTDPNGDDIYYLFDWGDGTYSEWIGPKNSGEIVEKTHSWTEEGDYEIRVKAKDDRGVQSEWSDPLPISMPKNKQLIDLPFFDIFEKFPRLFPILRNILGM